MNTTMELDRAAQLYKEAKATDPKAGTVPEAFKAGYNVVLRPRLA